MNFDVSWKREKRLKEIYEQTDRNIFSESR